MPPEKWQEGITALMLNYSFSGYKEYGSSEDSDDAESKYLESKSAWLTIYGPA
ncbi:hypothetical protein MJM83_30000 [Salmonella enterica subsp. enterica serovar Montevideo]|nr:hypothetical protein [Salmonella enterica subsp. enterica serovar Montevideo]